MMINAHREMPRKATGESYVWDQEKEKLFLEKLDDHLAATGGKQPTGSILELRAHYKRDQYRQMLIVCFFQDNKECTHLRYEGLRNKELYYNIFEKNHAAGASGFGSVTMGGGSTPMFEFDFSMDQSETHPVLENDISPSIGAQRQSNTRGMNDDGGPSRSRGSTGKRKQRDATDEMTYTAMEEIANHFRGHSQSTTSSVQNTHNLDIVDCMNIMEEMSVPQYQRMIMWYYFDAYPQLQRPFCVLDDDDRRGIIASVVTSQMPPPS
ncbi:hypothetical protein TIFTF001_047558 [Ficus carica]|uniref:Uncharacterized protein n=1 Tax=Ficus carica TaxID=3494 RepID=A0AA88CMI8_FICCA|nr:hypothetical protein TIFTF001_047558 [Ficus carica]